MSGPLTECLASRHTLPAAALLLTAIASAPLIYRHLYARQRPADETPETDPQASDPPLLQKHSELKSYTTSLFTYPGVRVFYRRHPKADELPTTPSPIPLLVFIHGLGGSAAQFNSLLTSLIHVSSCLAIDLPGCGLSQFAPTDWDAYTTDSLLELLETVIDGHREKSAGQNVVLIGHSMGSALAARLASKTVPQPTALSKHVLGLVAICPPSKPPADKELVMFKRLLHIPTPLFDLIRAWDCRGGIESASVRRFVGAGASKEAKRLQYRFNSQSRTAVWRRMAWGFLPLPEKDRPTGGFAGSDVWKGVNAPVYLISGADDHVTKPADAERIRDWLSEDTDMSASPPDGPVVVDSAAPVDIHLASGTAKTRIEDLTEEDFQRGKTLAPADDPHEDPSTPREDPPEGIPPMPTRPKRSVDLINLPSPATHALLYSPATVRILGGLISDFLTTRVSGRLSLGWQLQYLSKEGKWDVKNLAKWQKVEPVSEPVAGVFRAMKTLREVDESHSPRAFVSRWGGSIKDIIDISHDTPVYDPSGLEAGGVRYHKLPSVSKIPPTTEEVEAFIALVDKIRAEQQADGKAMPEAAVAVHCHYGFNRTGFFIVCYLIERCGYETQAAIEEFARARPKGIRHQHFLDQLYVRYSALNKRASS